MYDLGEPNHAGSRAITGPLVPGMSIAMKGGRLGKYCTTRGGTRCDSDTLTEDETFLIVDAGDGYIAFKVTDTCRDTDIANLVLEGWQAFMQRTRWFHSRMQTGACP